MTNRVFCQAGIGGLVGLAFGLVAAAAAAEPRFRSPAPCLADGRCVIQQYFDHDSGPGYRDYRCGALSYDGHDGTDIAVKTLTQMRAGVPVVAAAPGVVTALRDGMDDIDVRTLPPGAVDQRGAGNVVILDHGDGWQTWYGHLRKGSVAVQKGDRLAAGDAVGLIGMSGNAAFAHLEFRVTHQDRPLDPFTGPDGPVDCARLPRGGLWDQEAIAQLAYRPGGRLHSGFSQTVPTMAAVSDGRIGVERVGADATALAFFVLLYGVQAGDGFWMRMTDADGRVVAETTDRIARNQIRYFHFIGLPRNSRDWRPGRYFGRFELRRGGPEDVVLRIDEQVLVP